MSAESLPSALSRVADISGLLGDHPAIFLDYDGTLSPIVPDPNAARIGDAERSVLRKLARRAPVAIVSGRNLSELRALVGLNGIIYSGNHGWEIEGPGISTFQHRAPELEADLDRAQRLLEEGARHLEGIWVERKRFAIAVHTRKAPWARQAAGELATWAARRSDGLRTTGGKEIWELRPQISWDKGRALGLVLDSLPDGHVPLSIGDDVTDEDALRVAASRGGVGIVVGEPAPVDTSASYSLADPERVSEFLRLLSGAI
ncbi:MAG: trehalose-phosphatase [Acidimicrobiia bacterium]